MAVFTSRETDVEDRWDAEPLGEAQRADGELRTLIDWLTASETRPPREEVQRHGEEVKDYWDQ